jgi:hypothetical protein
MITNINLITDVPTKNNGQGIERSNVSIAGWNVTYYGKMNLFVANH